MGFVEREMEEIGSALLEEEVESPRWKQLHAAQQALKWATEPRGFAAPLDYIGGRKPGSGGAPRE